MSYNYRLNEYIRHAESEINATFNPENIRFFRARIEHLLWLKYSPVPIEGRYLI